MDKIHRFVECLVPISNCNLKCEYCYVIQENRRDTKASLFQATPTEIGKAFNKERWGGTLLVNLCGFGETLIPKEMPQIIFEILGQGHYINVTNNGTMTDRFDEIVRFPEELLHRLSFSFSLHYVELKNRGLLNTFVENVHKVRNAGCSYLIQLNLCDAYIELEGEIQEFCRRNFGALPQLALTRDEVNKTKAGLGIYSNRSDEEYLEYGSHYNSPMFDFTVQNFNVKRHEFCYAGDWSFKLDLGSGELRSCYFSRPYYNIYKNLSEKIKANTVGNNCGCAYCINSSHFMSLGIIPELNTPSYLELRNRDTGNWYEPQMKEFLSSKFIETNPTYGNVKKLKANTKFRIKHYGRLYLSKLKRFVLKKYEKVAKSK